MQDQAMAFSNPELAVSIMFQATTGRPIVLSKGIGDAWLLQCNGVHFIQDPTNKQEIAVVERAVNELADAGYRSDCSFRLLLTVRRPVVTAVRPGLSIWPFGPVR